MMEAIADDAQANQPPNRRDEQQIAQLLRAMRCPFGPHFFVEQLAAFVRDRCPEPSEQLPRVDIWYAGEPLAVCHIIAVAPSWVAIAVRDRHTRDAEMRTEMIPYEMISRVTIGAPVPRSRGMGFDREHRPEIVEDAQAPLHMLVTAAQPVGEELVASPPAIDASSSKPCQ